MQKIFILLILVSMLLSVLIYLELNNNKCKKCPVCPKTKKPKDDRIIKIKQEVYTDILKRTIKVFKKLNIPVFLSSGTCLGYFREGKFIDYDYDIDVGIMAEDYNPLIIDELAKEGIKLYRTMGKKEDGLELSFRKNGTPLGKYAKIDVFLHYRKKEKGKNTISWYTFAAPKFKKKIQYRVSDFKLAPVKFMGLEVLVPSPTLKYIEEHYGKDWMVPKKPFSEYVYHKSPKSIVK